MRKREEGEREERKRKSKGREEKWKEEGKREKRRKGQKRGKARGRKERMRGVCDHKLQKEMTKTFQCMYITLFPSLSPFFAFQCHFSSVYANQRTETEEAWERG